jgi:hypothetical protein
MDMHTIWNAIKPRVSNWSVDDIDAKNKKSKNKRMKKAGVVFGPNGYFKLKDPSGKTIRFTMTDAGFSQSVSVNVPSMLSHQLSIIKKSIGNIENSCVLIPGANRYESELSVDDFKGICVYTSFEARAFGGSNVTILYTGIPAPALAMAANPLIGVNIFWYYASSIIILSGIDMDNAITASITGTIGYIYNANYE